MDVIRGENLRQHGNTATRQHGEHRSAQNETQVAAGPTVPLCTATSMPPFVVAKVGRSGSRIRATGVSSGQMK